MWKEVKYVIFIVVISSFLFFTVKYYFSDENIKKSYRSYNSIDERIKIYSLKLPILENDTNDVIEYVNQTNKKKKKKFNFWKLLEND
jgi:hypothetical protein|tara:strand:+ start:168 stop:428 length:261 start_codon:yes stop_codon:yes gene_type:complete